MSNEMEVFSLDKYIMHHVSDSPQWHLPFLPPITLPAPLTLHGFMLILCASFIFVLFCILYRKKARVPTGITNFLEYLVLYIRDDVVIPCLGKEDGRRMAPLFLTFFFFILGLNLLGLIPLFSTATSNFNVTGGLAVITFIFMVFGAILKNGPMGFLRAIIPSGVPGPVLIILVPIEVMGLFIKTFALMIRLFANMLSGHIVILSLLGLVVLLGYFTLVVLLPMTLFIYILEVFVAFLQAYVFTLLSAMFIGQTYHPEH